jgi:hypothetical protein
MPDWPRPEFEETREHRVECPYVAPSASTAACSYIVVRASDIEGELINIALVGA